MEDEIRSVSRDFEHVFIYTKFNALDGFYDPNSLAALYVRFLSVKIRGEKLLSCEMCEGSSPRYAASSVMPK